MKTIGHLGYQLSNLILLGLTILFVSACKPSDGVTSGDIVDSEEGEPVELTLGSGPFFLEDSRVGLADLSSYTATLIRSFEGSDSGAPTEWTETYVLKRDDGAAASQMTIDITGDNPPDHIFVAEIGENAYEKFGASDCAAAAINLEISSIERMDPAGLLSGLLGADEAGQEEIDGVTADHYTFDERALGKADLEESSGEIWVAADGGVI